MRKLLFIFLLSPTLLLSQNSDLDNVVGDLILLTGQYVEPAAEAASYQASGGWYTSAKKKALGDLEIALQANFLFIPQQRAQFLVDAASLKNISVQNATGNIQIPTALGGESQVVLEGSIDGEVFEFDAPEGLDQNAVNHYQLQVGLGLWKGTTLIGRFSPKIKIDKTHYQVLGMGLQHNLSQWVPGLETSTFDISALLAFTVFDVSDAFSPANMVLGSIDAIAVNGESYMFNLLASKSLKRFNLSAGIGITQSSFAYKIGGEGEILLSLLNQALATFDANKTNFKVDLGLDYRIKHFSLNAMYTYGEYSNMLFGINYNLI